jgi:multiple sugar transport system substrate-binding protein
MSKKLICLILSLVFLSMVVFTGCTVPFASQKVLKISMSGSPQPHEKEYIVNDFIKGFETKHNVKVEVDFVSQADSIKKIQSEQESNNIVSDVLLVDTANMAPYVNGGWVEDITNTINASKVNLTNMFDNSIKKDGKTYFAPISFDVYITIANRDAIEYLPSGLSEEDVVNGLTWDQYADWAIAIAKGEGVGKTMMPANMTGSQLLYPMGGLGMAYGAKFPEFNSAGFKEAMSIISKMAAGDAFYPEQDQYTAPTDPLKSGAVWLTFAHMGPIGVAYNAAPNEYIIGAAPKGSKGAGSTAGAWCYGIQKGAKNKALAEKFISYILDSKVNYDYCMQMGGLLSPIKEVEAILDTDDVIMLAGAKMLDTTIISGVPSTEYTDWNAVKLLYGDLLNEILTDKAVPDDEFFDGLQNELEGLKK